MKLTNASTLAKRQKR